MILTTIRAPCSNSFARGGGGRGAADGPKRRRQYGAAGLGSARGGGEGAGVRESALEKVRNRRSNAWGGGGGWASMVRCAVMAERAAAVSPISPRVPCALPAASPLRVPCVQQPPRMGHARGKGGLYRLQRRIS